MSRDPHSGSAFPTPSDYQEALQFPATAFADPVLAAGTPRTNALGLPQPITGAFAAVFPMETEAGRFAVRCFLTHVADQQARYRAVARHLAEADVPGTVTFDYQPEGVRVAGQPYPILKMAWADGEGLAAFTERHLGDSETLRALAAAWRALLADTEAAGIAHGDLQHGNVLVRTDDGAMRLTLVDYDTLFVPSLAGRTSAEVGHRNYQHPDRTETDFDAGLDHFAGLVVYTALRALDAQPDLWPRFSTGENMLFQAGDFYDPAASPLFAALREIDGIGPLVEALERACYLEPGAVPSLEEVLGGATLPERSGPKRRRANGERPARRSRFEASFLPTVIAVAILLIAVAAVGRGWATLVLAVIAMGVLGWQVYRGYRRQSPVRRQRRMAREAAVLGQWIADLEDTRRELDRERRDFLAGLDTFRADRLAELRDAVLDRHLRHHFIGELDEVEGVGHRAVVRLKAVGIRTAFHATADRVAEAKGLTSETRRLVAAWRAALVAEVADAVPESLSPAEEQRLNRQVERRLASLDAEAARVAAKAEVQRGELAHVHEQQRATPRLTPGRYVLFLLRLRPLPRAQSVASSAPILQRPQQPAPVAPPAPERPEAVWWEEV
ncbi:MAG: hypothetical protein ABJF88_03990 [Rhodothermales bacterium]